MKKIIIEHKLEEIHISNVSFDDCIIAYKNKKIYGAILCMNRVWIGNNSNGDNYSSQNLKQIIDMIFENCELFVL